MPVLLPTVFAPQGLKVAVIEGHDIGGTCVNRGCVPSKALLAASGRVRDLKNAMHLQSMGIQVPATPSYLLSPHRKDQRLAMAVNAAVQQPELARAYRAR